jgi:hypothetical protein
VVLRLKLTVLAVLAAAVLVALPGAARAATPSAHAAVRVHHHVPGAYGAHLRVRWFTSSAWD